MSREERRHIHMDENPDIIELQVEDKALELKFITCDLYKKEDMEKCVRKICKLKDLKYDQQFDVSANRQELLLSFKKAQRSLTTMAGVTNFYCIYGQFNNLWLLLYFVRIGDKNNFAAFYKDPRGQPMPMQLQNNLEEIFQQPVKIVENYKDDLERDNDKYYGPVTIRNLLKVLCNKWTDESFIGTFNTLSFATSEDVCRDKFCTATKKAKELGTKKEFIQNLRTFADQIPGKKSKGKVEAYEKEVQNLGNNEDKADLKKLQKLRDEILDDKEIKQLKEDHKSMCEKEDGEIKGFKHEIQRKHPKEMDVLRNIFCIVDGCKLHYSKLKAYLEPIKVSLQMKDEELELLYEAEKKLKEQQGDKKKKTDGDEPEDKTWKKADKPEETESTELQRKLEEVVIGMDRSTEDQPKASQEDIDILKAAVEFIQKNTLRDKMSVTNWTAEDVINWAKNKKGCLGKDLKDIYDAIIVMNRALSLDQAKNLRDTQILAIILFFYKMGNAGKLCQVKTGEGKTIIVSMLAAIRCLQGYTVDIITSNIVLAQEGAKETKRFFYLMNLTVKEGNEPYSYKADVLYGTISKFQFDYLRDLTEGTTIRMNRKFQQVILDEVDSMLVDNGGNIAKISSSFPGMECLRYVYIKIWKELFKARKAFAEKHENEIRDFGNKNQNVNEAEFNKNYKLLLDRLLEEEIPFVEEWLNKINYLDYPLIPKYLGEYCHLKKQTWIKNAIHAMYNCNENEHYRVCLRNENPKEKKNEEKTAKEKKEDEEKEKFIAPVDYSNTGVTLTNTIWSNGLHQFVQLKHNVELTFECLTSSFISNIGYIKLYPNHLIFGLSGTLGSTNEQKLLQEIYGVDYAKVPTFKKKKFEEEKGLVVEDSSWAIKVVNQIKDTVKADRAILVICQTLKDLHLVKETLMKYENTVGYKHLRIFDDENNPRVITDELARKKEVVLSTNLAGRGTNLKTSPEVEEKGGLHVCVTFLPCNVRVEEQAFGRTSRQGNAGTANLIVRQSELDQLEIPADSKFKDIKAKRNELEQNRINTIREELVPDLTFKDKIFDHFCRFSADLQGGENGPIFKMLMKDLKEYWAFWLDKRDYKKGLSKNLDPAKEFESFRASQVVKSIVSSKQVSHNPYNCLKIADVYILKEKPKEAFQCLNRALYLEPNCIAGAHLRIFVLTIEGANLVLEKCKQFLKDILHISFIKSAYKEKVEHHLKRAKSIIQQEVAYNNDNLNMNSLEFKNILQIHPGNFFLKYLYSRTACLQLHLGNIDTLLKQCAKYNVVDFEARIETDLVAISKAADMNPQECEKYFTNREVWELHDIGVDTIYSLKPIVSDIPFLAIALAFIAAGIACLVIGLAWLPSFPLMSSIGGALISEGIVDIVVRVIELNSEEFNALDYAKSKFITIGKAVLTFGLDALIQCSTILQKAVEFCRKMVKMLDKLTHFTEIVNIVKGKLGDIIDFLEKKLLDTFDFSKLSDAARALKLDELAKAKEKIDKELFQELKQVDGVDKVSRKALVQGFVQDVGKATAKRLGVSALNAVASKVFLKNALKNVATKAIKQAFVDDFKKSNDLKRKLKNAWNYEPCSNVYVTNQKQKINEDTTCMTQAVDFYKNHEKVFNKIGVSISDDSLEKISEWAQLLDAIIHFLTEVNIIVTYRTEAKKHLLRSLQDGSSENNVDTAIDRISTILAEPVIQMVTKAWNDASELKNCSKKVKS